MRDGFIKVAAASIVGKVADCRYNEEQIVKTVLEMAEKLVDTGGRVDKFNKRYSKAK